MVKKLKISFVVFSSLVGTILFLGLCQFLHGVIFPKKSQIEKLELYRSIRYSASPSSDNQFSLLGRPLMYQLNVQILSLILSGMIDSFSSSSTKWIGYGILICLLQAPHFMACLSIKKIDSKTTLDTNVQKTSYRFEVVHDVALIGLIMISYIKTPLLIYQSISATVTIILTVAITIWLVNGGISRLVRRIKRKVKKLIRAPKPRLRLNPAPS